MAKAALLVMDVQSGVLKMANASESYFQRLAATTAAARAAGLPVIYIKSFLRKGFPDASLRNKVVSRVASLGPDVFVEGSPFTEFPPEVVPAEGDAIVVKRRNSSFAGTDLEVLLRSQGIEHILLLGVMTSGVVLSTVRQAADLDYQITVIEDLCLDVNPDVHQLLMTKVFPMQASVVSSEDAVKGL